MTKSPDTYMSPANYHWKFHPFPAIKPPMEKPLVVLCAEFGQNLVPVLVQAFQSTLSNQPIGFIMHGLYNQDGNNCPHYLADQVHYWMELPEIPEG